MELIKITEQNGKKAVSARELYEFLGFDKSQWSRWYKTNILDDELFIENVDYITSLVEAVRYFSDNGWEVYLKEHPAMCFKQDISLYKKLIKINKVFILNPFLETSNIINILYTSLYFSYFTSIKHHPEAKKPNHVCIAFLF